jgi:hypothetical protein
MAIFLNNPRFTGFTTIGSVATNGYVGVFEPGTTTPKLTYSDPELTSVNATTSLSGVSVIQLDADGGKWIFFTGKAKVRLYNSSGVQQWEKDNIQLSPDDSAEWINEKTAVYASASTFTLSGDNTTEYHIGRRVKLVGDTMGDAYATISNSTYSAPSTTVTITLDSGDSIDNTLTTSFTGINSAINESIGFDAIAGSTTIAAIAALAVTDSNIIVGNGTTWVAESGATARASLGLTIGTHVQAWDADLDAIAALAKTDSNIIVGNGTTWVAESGATARTSLGLGTGDSLVFTMVTSSTTTPGYRWIETDATSGNMSYDIIAAAEQWLLRIADDGFSTATNIITIDRTNNTCDEIDFTTTSLRHGNVEIPTISSTHTFTNKTYSGGTITGTVAGSPTLSGSWTWTTTSAGTAPVTVESTDSGASPGPLLDLFRNSTTAAASDNLALIRWTAKDSGGNTTSYAQILGILLDPTDTSEDGDLRFQTINAGTSATRMKVGQGVVIGSPTGDDKGSGTINAASTIYENNVEVSKNSTSATHTCQQLELGAATDTTFTRPAAGRAQIEGREIVTAAADATVLTSTIAELNKVDDSAAAVSGFVSGMRVYISEAGGASATTFDVSTNVTEGTFESVGPTGSGATNTWAAMDSITAGARIAIIRVFCYVLGDESATNMIGQVYIRMTGDSTATGNRNRVLYIQTDNNNEVEVPEEADQVEIFVPLDASRRFDVTWSALNDAARNIDLYLVGFIL